MEQQLIQIVNDILKIGSFIYKGSDNSVNPLENYFSHKIKDNSYSPYRILEKYFQDKMIDCFQYCLEKKINDWSLTELEVDLNEYLY